MGKRGSYESVFCSFVVILLMFYCTSAQDDGIKQVTDDPIGNVNLSPYQQWLSAYECLQNTSSSCPGNFTLTESGNLWVAENDTTAYCTKGCADFSRDVLKCISLVKKDYIFRNGATVRNLNNTISSGCSTGFTGSTLKSSSASRGIYMNNILTTFAVSASIAWFLFTNLNNM